MPTLAAACRRRRPRLEAFALLLVVAAPLLAQTPSSRATAPVSSQAELSGAVRAFRAAHSHEILAELRALVDVPNVAANRDDLDRNIEVLQRMFLRRGFTTTALRAGESAPALYAERRTPGATGTVMFYAHYDGQPVDPAQWQTPPWQATLRTAATEDGGEIIPWDRLPVTLPDEARIYGRSTSDDKSPIVAWLAALDALAAAGLAPSVNLKVFLEGEEEAGSPHLEALLRAHASRLAADVWVFGDGPVHQSRQPLVSFGVRGTLGLELTLFGPARALHSGHYGNWAPNPAAELATLLATMRDSEGRILIDGVAERVRPAEPEALRANADAPPIDDALAASLALGRTEQAAATLAGSLLLPALNVRGLQSGAVGEQAANAIPIDARASIDFRLVPDLDPATLERLVEAHIRALGYHIVHERPDEAVRRRHGRLVHLEWGGGYPAYRTSMTTPIAQQIVDLVGDAAGRPVVAVPTLGGSLPLYLFAEVLDATIVTVPIVNHDNNQHAANENLRLQNLWDGIDTYAAIIARLDTTATSPASVPAR